MTLDYLPDAERINYGPDAGAYVGGPFRIVLHRTEGSSLDGALSVYRSKNVAPHLTVEMRAAKGRRVVQSNPFTRAARALENKPGGVDTNRWSAIQIELVGFSEDSADDDDEDVRWFGATVLRPIMRAFNVQPVAPTFYGSDCGWILASATAKQRMTGQQWNAFNGVCAHQHVPEQSHWDSGLFKIDLAFDAAQEDDDMTPEQEARQQRIEDKLDLLLGQEGYDPKTGAWDAITVTDGTSRRLSRLDQLREIHRELNQRLESRDPAAPGKDTLLGFAINAAAAGSRLVRKTGA